LDEQRFHHNNVISNFIVEINFTGTTQNERLSQKHKPIDYYTHLQARPPKVNSSTDYNTWKQIIWIDSQSTIYWIFSECAGKVIP